MDETTQRFLEDGTPPPNEIDVWHETSGVKKGRIYGLGLESIVVDRRLYHHGSGLQRT